MPHYRASSPASRAPLGTALLHVDSRAAAAGVRWGAVLFAVALTGISAAMSVPVPWTPVPFTMQPAAVLLAGVVLGARLGMVSQLLYLALGIAGASMFAISPQLLPGLARLVGPTGGFLLAFPAAAAVAGAFADRGWMDRVSHACVALLCAVLVLYSGGIAWMAVSLPAQTSAQIVAGLVPFFVTDLVKACAVAAVASAAARALGRRG